MTITAAVVALKAGNKALDAVSQNTANGNTIGFKSLQGIFEAMVTGGSLVNNQFTSAGSSSHIIQNVEKQGSILGTERQSNMAVIGAGLFVGFPNSQTTQNVYTAAGDWEVNYKNLLVNSGGIVAAGWKTDAQGNVTTGLTGNALTPIDLSGSQEYFLQTTQAKMVANITSDTPIVVPAQLVQVNFPVVDSLGSPHDFTATFERTGINPNTWAMSITCPDGVVTKTNGAGNPYGGGTPMVIVFDQNGLPQTFDGVAGAPPPMFVTWNVASTNAQNMAVTLDLGAIGAGDGLVSRASTQIPPKVIQDGQAMSTASGFETNESGLISMVYASGVRLPVYQLALASFPSINNLDPIPGNAFTSTAKSGVVIYGKPNTGSFGKIATGQIETSNVDFADQLTSMIQLQQFNSGNVKSIKTQDEITKELLSIR